MDIHITHRCVILNITTHVPGIQTSTHQSVCNSVVLPDQGEKSRETLGTVLPVSGFRSRVQAPHTWLVFWARARSTGSVNLTAPSFSQPLRILESLRLKQGRRKRPLARMTTQGTSRVSVKVGGR